ncbi:MAG TPA: S8 family peptidase [Niastella sp.]
MKKIATLIILGIASTGLAQAQFSRYIVQFTDKKGSPYTLSDAQVYLSAKSIARRTNQHIAIDSTDLPVNPAYLESIRNVPNVTIINNSKWLNQVLIKTTDANALATINSFPFVKKTNGIAARVSTGRNSLSNELAEVANKQPVSVDHVAAPTGTTALEYGSMYNQIHIHDADYLHKLGFTGRGMTIAILDAGFSSYLTNPVFDSVRLQGRVLGTWDYVDNNASVNEDALHGANVFSLMASNRPGVLVGSAPHASYWLFKTEDSGSEYPVEEQFWAVAAEFADSVGVDMINTSLGYANFDNSIFNYSYAQRNGKTAMITIAVDLAAKKGILVVVAAGNSGGSSTDLKYVGCPADAENAFTIGSIDINRNIAGSSSWGPNGAGLLKPNVVSVGAGAVVATTTGNPTTGNGTSYACPLMAGMVACLWQVFPEFTNMQIMDVVQKSAHKSTNPDYRFGYGIPNFKKAVALLTKQYASASTSFDNCVVSINWKSKDDTSAVYALQRKMPGETNFTGIGQVPSTSVSFKTTSYVYKDTIKAAGSGTVQYRILQTIRSADTTFEIATLQQTINAVCFPDNTLMALPSPFDQQLLVVVNTPEAVANMGIKITDMMGNIVYGKKTDKPAGYFSTPVNTSGWKSGIYEITLYNNNKRMYDRKVFKK